MNGWDWFIIIGWILISIISSLYDFNAKSILIWLATIVIICYAIGSER